MKRRRLSNRDRVKIFEASGGRCHLCGTKIQVGEPWDTDHDNPLWLGGADNLGNLRPAHTKCHRRKSGEDNRTRAKSDRVRQKHIGAHRPHHRWGYGKNDPVKKKITGEVVPR